MTIQSPVYAGVIVVGAPMVIDGTLTTGSVVAASMLASRMIAPMATLCGVLARWQQVKAAKEGLDSIMQLPTENQREETPIRRTCCAATIFSSRRSSAITRKIPHGATH